MSTPRHAKFKIYADIVCLEMESPVGGKFWGQGLRLGYTPVWVRDIQRVKYGLLQGSGHDAGRWVLAAWYDTQWVAINLPRSDIAGLQRARLWPAGTPLPYDTLTAYTPLPQGI